MNEYKNAQALIRLSGMGGIHPARRRFYSTAAGSSIIGRIMGTAVATAVSSAIDNYAESAAKANAEEAERAEIRREYNKKCLTFLQTVRIAGLRPAEKCIVNTASLKWYKKIHIGIYFLQKIVDKCIKSLYYRQRTK